MKRTQALYELQQTDQEIEKIKRRLKEIRAKLGATAEMKRAEKAVTDAESLMARRRAASRDIDLEVRSVIQHIKVNEQRLYSGSVTNPKELKNLQDDTQSLKRWQDKKEQELLEAMMSEEEAESALAQAREKLAQLTSRLEQEHADLIGERSNLNERQASLAETRQELVEALGSEDVKVYEDLRQRKGGRAVVAVVDNICGGCSMPPPTSQLQKAASGSALVFCNNCGRILYLP